MLVEDPRKTEKVARKTLVLGQQQTGAETKIRSEHSPNTSVFQHKNQPTKDGKVRLISTKFHKFFYRLYLFLAAFGFLGLGVYSYSAVRLSETGFWIIIASIFAAVILRIFLPTEKVTAASEYSRLPLNSLYSYMLCQILAGEKRVFISGEINYQFNGDDLPKVGETNALGLFADKPMFEICTTAVFVCPFKELPFYLLDKSGERDYQRWQQQVETELNQALNLIYRSTEHNFTAGLWGMRPLSVETPLMRLPKSDPIFGIENCQITGNFSIVCEEFEVTDIIEQTYEEWLDFATTLLSETDAMNDAKIDATVLLSEVSQKTRAYILAFPETRLNADEVKQLAKLLLRRAKGEPIAYILGEKEFWSLPLKVSEHTLIPRPDTEILVEQALEIAKQRLNSPHFSGELAILDLGTGTGAIALALASELKPLTQKCGAILNIFGVDRIAEAVELARENARNNQLEVTFLQSSWFDELDPTIKFDVIVSNPPYIDGKDPHLAQGDVRFEPLSALVAEEEGYADLRHIIEQAPHFLKPQGHLLLEHGWQQGEKVRSIFTENGWQQVQTLKDYGDNERVTSASIEE